MSDPLTLLYFPVYQGNIDITVDIQLSEVTMEEEFFL